MKSMRFTAMFLCFTICFTAFFAYMHGDTYANHEEIVSDYVTVEDGKVVGGNAELVENGIIAIGTPEKNAEPTNEPTESLTNTTDTEASVIPSVDVSLPEAESADDTRFEAESVYTEETTPGKDIADVKDNALVTGKNDTESTVPEIAPNAVSPDVPTETVKATWAMNYGNKDVWNDKKTSTYSNLTNAITELVWGSDSAVYSIYSIEITSGQSLTMRIASNISHSCGVQRRDEMKDYPVFFVNGGTLNISGLSSNYFVIKGNKNITNQTPSIESDPLIVLFSGTVTLNYVNLHSNTCGANETRKPKYPNDIGHGSAICMNNGTMNLNNVSINNCGFHNDVEIARGVVYVGNGNATFTNVTIRENNLSNISSSYGGGIYVGGGTVTYNSGSINNNKVSTDGGGICCYGGTVNINGGDIFSNYAPHGGGLYVIDSGKIKMSGGTVRDNTNGGGVFVFAGAEFELSGGEIRSNTAGNYRGGGVAIYNNSTGKFTMTGGTISGHTAGGIAQTGNGGTLEITGGTIRGNGSTGVYGGGIYAEAGSVRISGGTIGENGAPNTANNGGGVCVEGSTTLEISGNTTIQYNTATTYGGGIYVGGGTVTYNNGSIHDNSAGIDGGGICCYGGTVNVNNGDIYSNSASYGGGLYVKGPGTMNMSGGTVRNNTNGSGVYLYAGANFVLSGGEIRSNTTGSILGGGVSIYDNANGKFTMTGGTISGHNADNHHGIAQTGNGGTLEITGGTISGNGSTGFNGGGIYANVGSVIISGGTIGESGAPNTANNGGGVYVEGSTTLEISGSAKIQFNTATTNGGGICIVNAGISSITNAEICDNKAGSLGGGVYFNSADSSTISNSIINGNTASNDAGGGICVDTTVVTMSGNNEVNSNVAKMYGGGIVVRSDAATATLNINTGSTDTGSTSVNANSISQYSGGGIHVGANGTLNMKGGYINNNYTTHQNGGGIDTQGVVSLNGTTVSNNDSVLDGGGICVRGANAKLTMVGGTVSENETSSGNGGGLCIKDTSIKSTVTGTVFTGNTALFETPDMTSADSTGKLNRVYLSSTGNGGAIYATGLNSVVEISDAHIGDVVEGGYSNKAINGGAVAVLYGANVTVSNSDVIYNSALRCGGAYFVLGFGAGESEPNATTTLSVVGGKVENNYARAYTAYDKDNEEGSAFDDAFLSLQSEMGGGGFFFRGTSYDKKKVTIEIDGTAINNNSSPRGGAIHHHESVNATIGNASFEGNSSSLLGGVLCFIKNSSTAEFTDCTFTNNNSTLRGGAFYIQTNGVSVTGCTFTGNNAQLGGAIQTQSATNTNIDLKVENTDFESNRANYGGAIATTNFNLTTGKQSNTHNYTITLTDCDFTGNHATASGGAILVGNMVTVNMTGGYMTGNNAGEDESGIEPIASNQGATASLAGAGGAVAVFDGTFNYTVNATNKGAIYGNTATVVGDDVFSNGSPTSKLNLPAVSAMNLTGYTYEEGKTPDWFEDYAEGEPSGMNSKIRSSERYRFSDNTIRAILDNINTEGKYVAITIGVSVNLGELVITKSGTDIDPDQVFVFKVSGVSKRSGDTIELTVSIKGTGSVKIVDLPVGDYTVSELTSWSWRYGVTTIKVDGSTVQITNNGTSVKVEPDHIDHSVEFINSLQNNKWLSHGTAPIKNVPTNGTVAYSTVVLDLPKQKTV